MIYAGIRTTTNCVYLKLIFFLNFMIPKTYQIAPLCSSRYVICTFCFVFMFWKYGIWIIFKQCTAIAIGLPMKSHTNRIFVNPKPKFYIVKWSIKFSFISIFSSSCIDLGLSRPDWFFWPSIWFRSVVWPLWSSCFCYRCTGMSMLFIIHGGVCCRWKSFDWCCN